MTQFPDFPNDAIIRVGEGRGFVVAEPGDDGTRFVVTAAHCLPWFPPCASISFTEERTYMALLGPALRNAGDDLVRADWAKSRTVTAECLFVDPVADIALLGEPDNQMFSEQADEFEALVHSVDPLAPARLTEPRCRAWLLSLDRRWFTCKVTNVGSGPLWIQEAAEPIRGGMSGSPILTSDGQAIGIVVASSGSIDLEPHTEHGPCPRLAQHLPGWFVATLGPAGSPEHL